MSAADAFQFVNPLVIPGWLMLVFMPRSQWTRIVATFVIPSVLAVVYLTLLATNKPPDGAGFGSLEQVTLLFSNPWILLAGWIHYLAFDLFVGAWEVRDAQRLKISHLLVVPCLIFTFMIGPVGLGAYFVLRLVMIRRQTAAA